jgi:NADPH2:quinone reductase
MIGGFVIATTSTDEKGALAREAGADHVVRYDGFARHAREITAGEGVAAVYDGVGRTTFEESLKSLRAFGFMILYGAASGQPEPLTLARLAPLGSLYVQRPTLATYTRTPQLLRDRAAKVFQLMAEGRLKVTIGARYALSDARQAHIDLQARKTTGKIILVP